MKSETSGRINNMHCGEGSRKCKLDPFPDSSPFPLLELKSVFPPVFFHCGPRKNTKGFSIAMVEAKGERGDIQPLCASEPSASVQAGRPSAQPEAPPTPPHLLG